jgi:TonB family protein
MPRQFVLLPIVCLMMAGCSSIALPVPVTSHAVSAADYPPVAVKLGVQGVTKLKYLVGTDGLVQSVEILDSSGSGILDDASIAMVKDRWRFRPALRNDKPVAVTLTAMIHWELKSKPPQSPE